MAKQVRPFTRMEVAIANPVVKVVSRLNTWIYRASRGRLGNTWLRGAPVMLLTTIGRKSGQPRTAPVLYLRDGRSVVCVASKGGMDHHPLWYRNLQAHPDVEIQIGAEVREMRAITATDEQKARYWPQLLEMYRDFGDYQARTKRNIPVVILSPR